MNIISNAPQPRMDATVLKAPLPSPDALGVSETVKMLAHNDSVLLHAATPVKIPTAQMNVTNEHAQILKIQRLALMGQASSSDEISNQINNDITLSVLAYLEKRLASPESGWLKVPFNGMGLLGGRKSARSETKAKLKELTEGLSDVQNAITDLTSQIAVIQGNMSHVHEGSDEHRSLATKLGNKQQHLNALNTQANGLQAQINRLNQELNPVAALG